MALRLTLGTRLGALGVLSAALGLLVPATGANAAEPTPDVTASITHLTPAILPSTGAVTIAGAVHNGNRQGWRNATVRVLVAPTPFVDHSQARAAITAATEYTGSPVPGLNAMEEFGTLRADETERYSITLRRDQLGISGEEGVYPLGIEVVADGADGRIVLARATTFLPLSASSVPGRTVVLWPFLLPGHRRADGSYADEAGLLTLVGRGGQMRNLLSLARSTPKLGSDALVDPALVAVLTEIARRPATTDAARARRKVAASFLNDLTRFAKDYACAAVGFGRPDWPAVFRAPVGTALAKDINRATRSTMRARDLDCSRVEWPSPRSAARPILTSLRRNDTAAVVVSTRAVPDWQSTTGNLFTVQTAAGSLPLIVNDPLDAGVPGRQNVISLRQRILSEAVFGSLATRAAKAQRPSVIIVDPEFDPGSIKGSPLAPALSASVVLRKNLRATLRTELPRYTGNVPAAIGVNPLSAAHLSALADAVETDSVLNSMLADSSDRLEHVQAISALASESWRSQRADGLKAATSTSRLFNRELAAISVEGPRALTLSSQTGRFPVTIRNHTPHAIRVGIAMYASAAGVVFKSPARVRVAAGESHTTTATIDMDGQTVSSVYIRLTAKDGSSFGASTVFNVRSTRVGAAVWAAIGISVAFVAVALVRRFAGAGHEPPRPSLSPSDFDD